MSETYYSIKKSTLTGIADAVRGKTGGTAEIAVSGLAEAISGIAAAEEIAHADIPDYVKAEALAVAEKVKAVQTDNTITFITMSDSHHAGEQTDGWQTNINAGNLHAGMAAKALAYMLPLDFACYLGDYTFGNASTTTALLRAQIAEINGWLDEAYRGIPQFRTVGNHDTGEYSTLQGAEYLYSAIGKYCEGAVYGSTTYGYCYRDFEDKKLRVICLNSCEGETESGSDAAYIFSPAQLLWFAQTLYSVGAKTGWSVIVMCHYSLDYGGAYPASNIARAYVEGSSTTQNGTTIDFSGHNAAKFVANVHGHTHCFRVDKLYSVAKNSSGTYVGTAYDAKKIAIPNSCFYRNNSSSTATFWGITYGEDKAYDKTAGTADDTAFCVNVIDPDKQVFYSFCYGAGYDRTIDYGATVYHSVTNALTHVVSSNGAVSAEDGKEYTATLSAVSGYTMESVSVTMGGANITASTYTESSGIIRIAQVTGDVVITAKAAKVVAYHNLVPTAIDSNGASAPYTDGYSLSSAGQLSANSHFTTTGFIPFDGGAVHIYRIGGDGIAWNEYGARIAWYKADFSLKGSVMSYDKIGTSIYYPTKVEDSTAAAAFSTNANVAPPSGAGYFRVSAKGKGADLIITIDEEIT